MSTTSNEWLDLAWEQFLVYVLLVGLDNCRCPAQGSTPNRGRVESFQRIVAWIFNPTANRHICSEVLMEEWIKATRSNKRSWMMKMAAFQPWTGYDELFKCSQLMYAANSGDFPWMTRYCNVSVMDSIALALQIPGKLNFVGTRTFIYTLRLSEKHWCCENHD